MYLLYIQENSIGGVRAEKKTGRQGCVEILR